MAATTPPSPAPSPGAAGPSQATDRFVEQVADVVLKVGKILVEGGCETKLVEDTMDAVGTSFKGVQNCTANVVLTGITLGVSTQQATVTRIARIDSVGHNLWAIGQVMTLAKRCEQEHLEPGDVLAQLETIERGPFYPAPALALASAAGAVGFAIFYGASGVALAFVAVTAAVTMGVGRLLDHLLPSPYLSILGQAFVAALACALFHRLMPHVGIEVMLIPVLMLLVPGMTLTTAVLDTMSGNYISSGARLIMTLLVGLAIAVGATVALHYSGILTWQPS